MLTWKFGICIIPFFPLFAFFFFFFSKCILWKFYFVDVKLKLIIWYICSNKCVERTETKWLCLYYRPLWLYSNLCNLYLMCYRCGGICGSGGRAGRLLRSLCQNILGQNTEPRVSPDASTRVCVFMGMLGKHWSIENSSLAFRKCKIWLWKLLFQSFESPPPKRTFLLRKNTLCSLPLSIYHPHSGGHTRGELGVSFLFKGVWHTDWNQTINPAISKRPALPPEVIQLHL